MSDTMLLSSTLAAAKVPHLVVAGEDGADPKVTARLNRLLDLTERGQIRWEGDGDGDLYSTLSKYAQFSIVEVGFGETPDGYSLSVAFPSGSVGDLGTSDFEIHSDKYPVLSKLFASAKQHGVPDGTLKWPFPDYSNMADALSGLLSDY